MQRLAGLFLATAATIAVMWWWLGRPVAMPATAVPGRIECVSYAPFRADQTPFIESTNVEPWQIEEDLFRLSRLTDCVRTYSTRDFGSGLDALPPIAERVGIKVMLGVWLSRSRLRNRQEIEAAVALAKRYPSVITAIVVGNEVLLRGELSATDLAAAIAEVKAGVSVPVTYADVWEFWLRNRDLAQAVDFITIHILPYWEDFPIAPDRAGAHVDEIRSAVAKSFPGKDILIGEVGWPSAGRMREGALPSPVNQARVLEEVMARARAGNYRVNLIEAFDQPWKRKFEGTVGGYWGLLSSVGREPKFSPGQPVSNHALWRWQLAGGIAMAGLVFAGAMAARRDRPARPALDRRQLAGIVSIAVAAGVMVPWTIVDVAIESLGVGGWLFGAAYIVTAVAAPVAVAMALGGEIAIPPFARALGRPAERPPTIVARACGLILFLATVLATETALGLVFDPRYRDFRFAPLSAAVIPFAVASVAGVRGTAPPGRSETIAAATLAGSAVYIALNETFANWQALWLAAMLIALAGTLFRLRDGQST
jgi:exo-beta-1,3-glucanase (GH17 family)